MCAPPRFNFSSTAGRTHTHTDTHRHTHRHPRKHTRRVFFLRNIPPIVNKHRLVFILHLFVLFFYLLWEEGIVSYSPSRNSYKYVNASANQSSLVSSTAAATTTTTATATTAATTTPPPPTHPHSLMTIRFLSFDGVLSCRRRCCCPLVVFFSFLLFLCCVPPHSPRPSPPPDPPPASRVSIECFRVSWRCVTDKKKQIMYNNNNNNNNNISNSSNQYTSL